MFGKTTFAFVNSLVMHTHVQFQNEINFKHIKRTKNVRARELHMYFTFG